LNIWWLLVVAAAVVLPMVRVKAVAVRVDLEPLQVLPFLLDLQLL
jgi:hypothetical protein